MPFSAIAGNEAAKTAVLCMLVNPQIKSILVTGGVGTGKTALARSIASLDGSIPVLNAPVGITDDRLFGAIDIGKAVTGGEIELEPGLFSAADGGVICIDDIDLMDQRVSLLALENTVKGSVQLEREGLSTVFDCDVSVIATTSLARNRINRHLGDRFDISVRMVRASPEEHERSLRNCLDMADGDPLEMYREMDSRTMDRIRRARELLPSVRVLKKHRASIARICKTYGVSSYRGPISTARTAATLAALAGRKKTSDDDVILAAQLCLDHRRTIFGKKETKKKEEPQNLMAAHNGMKRFVHDDRGQNPETKIVKTMAEKKDIVEDLKDAGKVRQDEEELEAKVGEKFETIDIMEAADSKGAEADDGRKKFFESPWGQYTGFRIPRDECTDVAIDATIRAAAPHQRARGSTDGRIIIEKQDLREKIRTKQSEQTFLFLLDTSGSLIIRNRMAKVKAAILSMLQIHYVKRDRVGLMTFNEDNMELVMSPTRAINELSRTIDGIKIGRGTPLSAAFMKCWNFIRGYRRKHPEEICHIIVITDGKSTKALDKDKDPCEEALEIAEHLHAENVDWIVIDSGLGSSKSEMPERLAEKLGGRFFLLDDLESDSAPKRFW